MINVYTDKKLLPSDKLFVFDVDRYFPRFIMDLDINDEIVNFLFNTIERGTLVDKNRFKDRFGNLVALYNMSTSAKCMLSLYLSKGSVILNFNECGENAYIPMYRISDGSFFVEHSNVDLHSYRSPIMVDNIYFATGWRATNYIWTGEVLPDEY